MKKYITVLKNSKLFDGIDEKEISSMLVCLNAKVKSFKKGEAVFCEGDIIDNVCILAEGILHIDKSDYWGNHSIVGIITAGELFGEAYATGKNAILNNVTAVENSVVIFLDMSKILKTCASVCSFHTTVIQNLVFAISEKNRNLAQKLEHMSQRTTREKLLSYLSEQSKKQGSSKFEIPFNRSELAAFLSVDRSAMSNELCKMRDAGLLKFEKNKFELLYKG